MKLRSTSFCPHSSVVEQLPFKQLMRVRFLLGAQKFEKGFCSFFSFAVFSIFDIIEQYVFFLTSYYFRRGLFAEKSRLYYRGSFWHNLAINPNFDWCLGFSSKIRVENQD